MYRYTWVLSNLTFFSWPLTTIQMIYMIYIVPLIHSIRKKRIPKKFGSNFKIWKRWKISMKVNGYYVSLISVSIIDANNLDKKILVNNIPSEYTSFIHLSLLNFNLFLNFNHMMNCLIYPYNMLFNTFIKFFYFFLLCCKILYNIKSKFRILINFWNSLLFVFIIKLI